MPKGAMHRIQLLVLISVCLFCYSPKAIELCINEIELDIDKPLLDKSLAKAGVYADEIYGKSCIIVAKCGRWRSVNNKSLKR